MKNLTRGEKLDEEGWKKVVSKLPITELQKKDLLKLTPQTYIGLAVELTERAIAEIKSSRS